MARAKWEIGAARSRQVGKALNAPRDIGLVSVSKDMKDKTVRPPPSVRRPGCRSAAAAAAAAAAALQAHCEQLAPAAARAGLFDGQDRDLGLLHVRRDVVQPDGRGRPVADGARDDDHDQRRRRRDGVVQRERVPAQGDAHRHGCYARSSRPLSRHALQARRRTPPPFALRFWKPGSRPPSPPSDRRVLAM